MLVNMMNQFHWSQDQELLEWIRASRLDGFSKPMSDVDRDDVDKQEVLARLRKYIKEAVTKLPLLVNGVTS
jgi:hypothetical protein